MRPFCKNVIDFLIGGLDAYECSTMSGFIMGFSTLHVMDVCMHNHIRVCKESARWENFHPMDFFNIRYADLNLVVAAFGLCANPLISDVREKALRRHLNRMYIHLDEDVIDALIIDGGVGLSATATCSEWGGIHGRIISKLFCVYKAATRIQRTWRRYKGAVVRKCTPMEN